jgi:hypothetical protein
MAISNPRNVVDNTTSAEEELDAGTPSWFAAVAIGSSVIEEGAQLLAHVVQMIC